MATKDIARDVIYRAIINSTWNEELWNKPTLSDEIDADDLQEGIAKLVSYIRKNPNSKVGNSLLALYAPKRIDLSKEEEIERALNFVLGGQKSAIKNGVPIEQAQELGDLSGESSLDFKLFPQTHQHFEIDPKKAYTACVRPKILVNDPATWLSKLNQHNSPLDDRLKTNLLYLASQLAVIEQEFRERGMTFRINSGYRSEKVNRSVGGAENSYHKQGFASDISIPQREGKPVFLLISDLIRQKKVNDGELIVYNTFTHYAPVGYHKRINSSSIYKDLNVKNY